MRILLALDDSGRAMEEAVRLARERGADLTALFVQDSTWGVYIGHDGLCGSHARQDFLDYIGEQEEDSRLACLKMLRERAGDLPCAVKAVTGRVSEEILREAGEGYDLLVMAAPFRRGLEVVRDAPRAVLEKAACDVFLVRP